MRSDVEFARAPTLTCSSRGTCIATAELSLMFVSAIDRQQQLEAYGELAVKLALNLQPGQRLMILGPLTTGVSFEAAPLVLKIAASAYRAGASLVEVIWGD